MTADQVRRATAWTAAVVLQMETAERLRTMLAAPRIDGQVWCDAINGARVALLTAARGLESAGEWTVEHEPQWTAAYNAIREVEFEVAAVTSRRNAADAIDAYRNDATALWSRARGHAEAVR